MTYFAVLAADTAQAKADVAAAGCTHVAVAGYWADLQPNGAGTALDATALANLNQAIQDARSVGLKVIFEHALQYSPAWVRSAVEPFKDQSGNEWLSSGAGKTVRNWFWTANGRSYVQDFVQKVWNGLTPINRLAVDRIRFGGGYFGELQYPAEHLASPWSYWGFGSSMQTGTGLADGLTVCPNPGYTPFSGTDAQDVSWINWYLHGIENWMLWMIQTLKDVGWKCPLMCLHPGFSVRQNQARSAAGYRQSMAQGHDFVRAVGAYKNDPQVWPWSTWINGDDPIPGGTADSDQAAWKKLWAEAAVRGKLAGIWGENTGNEDNAGMDEIFENALAEGTPTAGYPLYFGPYPGAFRGYSGLAWLNYANLTGGVAGHATLSHYASKIAERS